MILSLISGIFFEYGSGFKFILLNGIGFLIVDINLASDSIEHYVTDKENFSIFIKLAMTKSQYVNLYSTTSLDFEITD